MKFVFSSLSQFSRTARRLRRAQKLALLPIAFAISSALAETPPGTAIRASEFLNSIGANSSVAVRGETAEKTSECAQFAGVRWLRAGVEGDVPVETFVALHQQAGLRFSWGLGSGGTNIARLIATARQLEPSGALLSFEGPNEPNNWGFTYQGQKGGRGDSWAPIAKLQRDLYHAVKSDPTLRKYPVWSITEGGAETDNVGLQFLTIPPRAGATMPAGTRYADFANVHNYYYHPNAAGLEDNKTWKAADPSSACRVDGLFGEYGVTWARHFRGYSEIELASLPRVTTETGATVGGEITEEIHGLNVLTLYLDQFRRGWSYTAIYLLHDRVDEGGNQQFGLYRPDYTPRKAAVYLHNLTTILADRGAVQIPGRLGYTISNQTDTVHDLLLQKSNGTFELVVWSELLKGANNVTIELAAPHASVKLYDTTVGTTSTKTLTNVRTVPLSLTDHPVILEIPR